MQHPLLKMLSLLHHSLIQESFPDLSFVAVFSPLLNECQLFYAEGLFGTSLLNPSRRVPGFMREGGRGETDNERITPILLPLVPEFI
ncbi:MAG: hypothetical protein ACK56F_08385, partial [bacterium]